MFGPGQALHAAPQQSRDVQRLDPAGQAVQEKGASFFDKPVGSGPFMLKSWEHGSKIVLEPPTRTIGSRANRIVKEVATADHRRGQ